ncbi:TlpA family protein disulfide reductase [Hymenobacter sp. BT186]|uniref:TlpA family protein disulfide reductase n=1 Tax=Hymenobacter telluris TaxID=2816474 RepID=A0A939EZB7_9BACT|nr:TlpA disulfide reductase family protein [Hymenobacter telluris]MBO0359377.1 TlpA family protein disulfide reductase [Hymenobacter telluris]MBW3375403.1 TlpA family protein disulfide reductase [Hymenobacter norwichensis]
MRPFLLASALGLLTLTATAQRASINRKTVFTDVDGRVLSKDEYKAKLRTGQFKVYNPQAEGKSFVSLSLQPADTPDAVRLKALTPLRAFNTAAPSFTATDLQGRTLTLETLRGKVVVLNFWFVNCPYCLEEMPNLKRVVTSYQPQDSVVFLSFALDKPERLKKFLEQRGDFGFAVVPEAKSFAQQFAIAGYPTTIVLNKQGQYIYDQEYTDNTVRLEEAIRRGLQP